MPADTPAGLPKPWSDFLGDLDFVLDEPFQLHCIGGFAAVVGYGLPRSTNDLNYRALVPYNRIIEFERLAGADSALARKHKVHLQRPGVESMPENYEDRVVEVFRGRFKHLRLYIPDPYDLALSKLSRNIARDREDVAFLAKSCGLDPRTFRERYREELRVTLIGDLRQHDQTLEFWIEAYFAEPAG
jgi:Nucleotidyltransferase of unknown function (DUF6036)